MTRIVSEKTKLDQIEGMLGTPDLTEWEQRFIESICARSWKNSTQNLSEKQLAIIDRIWEKHFA